jgi:metallophosphoesterase (TIGR03767 family)
MTDQAIRALNDNVQSPHSSGASMDFSLVTGDQADSNQRNEVEWVVRLLEGGPITPNSGVEDNQSLCGENGEAARYTGVQDYDDFEETDAFYDPDLPTGTWAAWPNYRNLMDAAQQGFVAEGSAVPTYVTNGNHDMLVQGNAAAIAPYELIATGCIKHFLPMPFSSPTPTVLQTHPENVVDVPADPNRQYVNRTQIRELHDTGAQGDAHGFDYVDQEELAASNQAASYYSFSPKPGLRLISIDTLSEAGIPGPSANGSIDDPQFRWLTGELDAAEQAGELTIVFGHHPLRTLDAELPDELAPPCLVNDAHGHDVNPGCDQDPRPSTPIRLEDDLKSLLLAHPHVIAYVAGHTHEHNVDAFARPDGSGGFWGIETSAIVDWPVQARVIEVLDNEDGTLSIFGTIIDHEGPITAPPSGSDAFAFDQATRVETLASIGRTLAFNDPQAGSGTGEGDPADRNVELLLPDPR